ncbi:MAG TPA: FecR domain-containing protein, partial [Polyangium sp.]|nr:FecR domain-containing protein [Polyangium sp.]
MDMTPLEKLGQTVRHASDEEASPETTIRHAREQALAKWNRRSTGFDRRLAFAGVLVFALVAALFLRVSVKDKPITYSVGPGDAPSALGVWIAAGSNAVPLRFSEGTQITLDPGARARVTDADANGATMLVERGHAHAKVVHVGQTTSWLLHAGPFDINVVGTEFDVAWDPTREVFDLRVSEGKVIVHGPLLNDGRAVTASESL